MQVGGLRAGLVKIELEADVDVAKVWLKLKLRLTCMELSQVELAPEATAKLKWTRTGRFTFRVGGRQHAEMDIKAEQRANLNFGAGVSGHMVTRVSEVCM